MTGEEAYWAGLGPEDKEDQCGQTAAAGPLCSQCGKPVNFALNGVLQTMCYDCHPHGRNAPSTMDLPALAERILKNSQNPHRRLPLATDREVTELARAYLELRRAAEETLERYRAMQKEAGA
jgi:hypothetical protein